MFTFYATDEWIPSGSNGTSAESLMQTVMSARSTKIQSNMKRAASALRRIMNGKSHCSQPSVIEPAVNAI